MFPGLGTLVNAAAVLAGSALGVLVGHRLSERTRDVVTDALGLVTLLIAATSATAVADPDLRAAVGSAAPTLVVLGSLVMGGVAGSVLGIERRLEDLGGWLRERLLRRARGGTDRERFVEGFVNSSLVFCVGPLTILGALNEGLGRGSEQLLLKATLDGFAAIAFAASLGWGVAASVVSVLVIQGSMTVVGLLLGDVLSDAEVAALAATGGLMLVGVALRLLRIRQVPVGDLLPALLLAPALTALVTAMRG